MPQLTSGWLTKLRHHIKSVLDEQLLNNFCINALTTNGCVFTTGCCDVRGKQQHTTKNARSSADREKGSWCGRSIVNEPDRSCDDENATATTPTTRQCCIVRPTNKQTHHLKYPQTKNLVLFARPRSVQSRLYTERKRYFFAECAGAAEWIVQYPERCPGRTVIHGRKLDRRVIEWPTPGIARAFRAISEGLKCRRSARRRRKLQLLDI